MVDHVVEHGDIERSVRNIQGLQRVRPGRYAVFDTERLHRFPEVIEHPDGAAGGLGLKSHDGGCTVKRGPNGNRTVAAAHVEHAFVADVEIPEGKRTSELAVPGIAK